MITLNPKLQNSNITTANSLLFNSLKIVVNVLFPFMLIPYISRVFSVEQIGIFNWDLSIVNYLAVLLGSNVYIMENNFFIIQVFSLVFMVDIMLYEIVYTATCNV